MGAQANMLPATAGEAHAPPFDGTSTDEEEAAVRCMVAVLYSPHSRAAATAAAAAAQQQQRLPTPAEANVFLTDFQQRPAAWPVCIAILNRFTVQQQQREQQRQQQQQESGGDEDDFESSLLYFAAQTLASVARAGFPQQLHLLLGTSCVTGGAADLAGAAAADATSSEQQQREEERGQQAAAAAAAAVYKELRHGLLQLLYGCRGAPRAVVRQLACALANSLLCGAASKPSPLLSGGGSTAAAPAGSLCSSSGVRNSESTTRGSDSARSFSTATAEATATAQGAAAGTAAAAQGRREAEEEMWKELATDLDEVLLALGRNVGPAGAAPLLELLIVLPQEVASPRVAVQDGQRLCVLLAMLRRYTVDALLAAASVFQSAVHAEQQLRQQQQQQPAHQEQYDAAAGRKLQETWWHLEKTAICAMRAWLSAHLQLFLSLPAIAALSPHLETAATSCCRGLFVALHRHHQQQELPEDAAAHGLLSGGTGAAGVPSSAFPLSAAAAPLGAAPAAHAKATAASPLGVLLQCLSRAAAINVDTAAGSFPGVQQQQEHRQQVRRVELETLQEASEAVAALAALAVALASPQQQRHAPSSTSGSSQGEQHHQAEQEQKQVADEQQLHASLPSIHFVLQEVVSCYAHACARLDVLSAETSPQQQQQQSLLLAADRLHAFSQGLLELAKEVLPGFLHNSSWPMEEDDAPAAKNAATAAPGSLPCALLHNSGSNSDLCCSSSSGTEGEYMESSNGRCQRSICESVKEICAFVVNVLMRHPCLDTKGIAVDFHYNLLFHFVTLASEQQELLQHLEALQYEQQQQMQQHCGRAAGWGCGGNGDSSSGHGEMADLEAGGATEVGGQGVDHRDAAGGGDASESAVGEGGVHNKSSRSGGSSTYVQLASEIAAVRASYASLAQEVEEKRQRLQPLLLQFLDVLMVEVGPPSVAAVLQEAAAAPTTRGSGGRIGAAGDGRAAAAASAVYGSQQQQQPHMAVDLERWGELRDESAIGLVEGTIVTGHRPLLQKATAKMAAALQALDPGAAADQTDAPNSPGGDEQDAGAGGKRGGGGGVAATAPWQRLEASLFVITTLASRCKGKEAAFIPKTLQLLPQILLPLTEAAAAAGARARAAAEEERQRRAREGGGGGRGEAAAEGEGAAAAAGIGAHDEEEGATAATRAASAKRKAEEAEVVCLFMYTAAGRFILWTAGYAAHDKHLFATLFELLAREGMQFVLSAAQRHREAYLGTEGTAACQLRAAAEDIVIEALKALVAAAAPTLLAADEAADDVTFLLQCLVSLVLLDGLSVESRSGLILAAGAALAPLPAARMRVLHSQMLQSLGANLCDALAEQQQGGGERRSSASTAARQAVTLFFAGLQCVRPARVLLPPPALASDCCEPLPPDSPYRHPVLDVLEEHWHVVEAVMHAPVKQEYLYEQSCYAIFSIISAARPHIARYTIFCRFLESLATSFEAYPTAYHLGVLRSLAGLCGGGAEQHLLAAVAVCLKRCTLSILRHIQEEGDRYVYRQPDLVGMMVDCVNISLLHVNLVLLCVGENPDLPGSSGSGSGGWFEALTLAVLQLAPTCHHPKVLHTFIIFFSRLAAWTHPPAQLYAGITGQNIPWLEQTCDTCQEAIVSLMLRPYPAAAAAGTATGRGRDGSSSCGTYLDATIHAIVKALTSVHAAVRSWIGNAAQALMVLLHQSTVAQQALGALETAVMGLHPHVLDPRQRAAFLCRCRAETNIRNFCLLLQQIANDAKTQFQRSKFAVAATADSIAAPSASPPPAATAAMYVPPLPVAASADVAAAATPRLPAGSGVASVLSSASAGGACEDAAMN